ncbi:MAG TPA: hypothetical protein VIF09_21935 [Polyangiaceae bacterium]
MSTARFGTFTLRTDCARCGQPIPVNAPAQGVHCSYCQNDVALPDDIWWHVLGKFDEEHGGMRNGQRDSKTIDIGGFTVHYEVTRCATPGASAASFEAPPWLRDLVQNARTVYVTDASLVAGSGSGEALVAKAALKPVLMTCPQCGAGLHITADTSRTTTCQYCSVDFYLPDDLWRRLHPVRVVEPWCVRFEGRTRRDDRDDQELAARRRKEGEQRARTERETFLHGDTVVRDAGVARARRSAIVAVLGVYGIMLLSLGVFGVALTSGPGGDVDVDANVCRAGVLLALFGACVALFMSLRVITLRTGPKNDAPMGIPWVLLLSGLFAPVINHGIMAAIAFSGAFGGKRNVSEEDRRRHVVSSRWEQRPMALLFAGLTVWWPFTLWCLITLSSATVRGGRLYFH